MKILGIETSCDETAASVIEGKSNEVKVLSNIVSSQIEIHKKYGGVVPEVAAREHVLNILPVVNEAMLRAGIDIRKNISIQIDSIAVTVGPGLITSLLTGVETAKTLAFAWKIPLVAVNHIEGHIYSNFIGKEKIELPAIILTVSGGHTLLALMGVNGKIKKIGETRDDAAGEAFDKAAQLLELGYPGGPEISRNAQLAKPEEYNIKLPRPMIDAPNYDFSFSGLKTALLYELKKDNNWKNKTPGYSAEFQQAIIDVLIHKTIKAAKEFKVKSVLLSGGVAANKELRGQMDLAVKNIPAKFFMPELAYTTDNAAMIATAGYFKTINKDFIDYQNLKVDCNQDLY